MSTLASKNQSSTSIDFGQTNNNKDMVRTFLEAMRDGKAVPVAAEADRYAVELCCAALQSARTGQPVVVPIAPDDYAQYATD